MYDRNEQLYCWFVNYSKAFHKKQHNILFEILSDLYLCDEDMDSCRNYTFNKTQLSDTIFFCRVP